MNENNDSDCHLINYAWFVKQGPLGLKFGMETGMGMEITKISIFYKFMMADTRPRPLEGERGGVSWWHLRMAPRFEVPYLKTLKSEVPFEVPYHVTWIVVSKSKMADTRFQTPLLEI